MAHAMGFAHEQTRSDRDDYVTVLMDNIDERWEHNYEKWDETTNETPYNYESIMHYQTKVWFWNFILQRVF